MSQTTKQIDKLIDKIKTFLRVDSKEFNYPRAELRQMRRKDRKECKKQGNLAYYQAKYEALFDVAYNTNKIFYHISRKDNNPKRDKLRNLVEKLHEEFCDNDFVKFLSKRAKDETDDVKAPYIASLLYRVLFDRSRKVVVEIRDNDDGLGEYIYKHLGKRIDFFTECGTEFGAIELSSILPIKRNQYNDLETSYNPNLFVSSLVFSVSQTGISIMSFLKKFTKKSADSDAINSVLNMLITRIMKLPNYVTSSDTANSITEDIAQYLEHDKASRVYIVKRFVNYAVESNDSTFLQRTLFRLNNVTQEKYPKLFEILEIEVGKIVVN